MDCSRCGNLQTPALRMAQAKARCKRLAPGSMASSSARQAARPESRRRPWSISPATSNWSAAESSDERHTSAGVEVAGHRQRGELVLVCYRLTLAAFTG